MFAQKNRRASLSEAFLFPVFLFPVFLFLVLKLAGALACLFGFVLTRPSETYFLRSGRTELPKNDLKSH